MLVEYKSILDQIIHPFTVVPRLAWQLVQLWNATYEYIHNPWTFSTAQMDFGKGELDTDYQLQTKQPLLP